MALSASSASRTVFRLAASEGGTSKRPGAAGLLKADRILKGMDRRDILRAGWINKRADRRKDVAYADSLAGKGMIACRINGILREVVLVDDLKSYG